MIGRSGERGSGISVLAAGHDDDVMCLEEKLYILEHAPGLLRTLVSECRITAQRLLV